MEVNWGLIEVNCLAAACKCIEKLKKKNIAERLIARDRLPLI